MIKDESAFVNDLLKQMTLEEKVTQLTFNSPAVKRLGIPEYNWWNEALHGVARAGTATVFPQAIALAATFDTDLIYKTAEAIADEARAKYNEAVKKGDIDIYKGLTMWSPNINIYRDPRWGRGQETYGEDPYLTAEMGIAYITGLQGEGKYLKAAACVKHFAVHSGPENIRHEFDARVSEKDLYETYLPAFEACIKRAKPAGVMGAYNRLNGTVCCGHRALIQDVLRGQWGFDGYFVSDCGAIADFHTYHMVTASPYESAAMALNAGCDLNCGNIYMYVYAAYEKGLIDEAAIDRAVGHLLKIRYRLGLFDDKCQYDKIPYEVNDCSEHQALSLEASRKSIVLLKNNGILPLDKKKLKAVAVIGPNADSQKMLLGNYSGSASRYVTLLEGIAASLGEGTRLYHSVGCHMTDIHMNRMTKADDRMAEAVSMAERSDVVIACLGYDASIEGEQNDPNNPEGAGDRADLLLPGRQEALLRALIQTGKPVIAIIGAGGAIALNGCENECSAVLHVWYPGSFGGQAVADILFGRCAPKGKLPVTFYKKAEDLPEFTDYSMQGRTYRYFQKQCLYPFGFGLTYSKVAVKGGSISGDIIADGRIKVLVEVENVGGRSVEEVVQVYIKNLDSQYAVPNYSLAAFCCIALEPGESRPVCAEVLKQAFEIVDETGRRYIDGTYYELYAGVSQPDAYSVSLCGTEPWRTVYTI